MSNVIDMAAGRPSRSFKIVVFFERREDGGVRAWCEDVPGFVLSHRDGNAVLLDVQPALEGILTAQLGEPIITTPLSNLREDLERCGVLDPLPHHLEYAALCA